VTTETTADPAAADDLDAETDLQDRGRSVFVTAVPSWLTSMVVHVIALLLLALLTIPANRKPDPNQLTIGKPTEQRDELEEFQEEELEPLNVDALTTSEVLPQVETEVVAEEPVLSPANDLDAAPIQVDLNPLGEDSAPRNDLLKQVNGFTGTGLEGRGAAARAAMVREGGGSEGSEAAVEAALKWFAAHQNPDGSWNLDHRGGPCQGRCRNPGARNDAPNGATALALLPFLGAGHTHKEGKYKKNVEAGLGFLLRNSVVIGQRGSLYDDGGNYYSHGLAAIVLCEAYAMTQDRNLMMPAQMAINETVFAQDPIGGGWRYQAKQPGDTSAVGWQLMALKSAHMAYLRVPPETVKGAIKFLDSVQADYGATYGYLTPGARSGTTAVGLLCRMYLGWKKDHPALTQGVELLSRRGPSRNDMYYNYYATQIMRHIGDDAWTKWNSVMRDYLVDSQAKGGHEAGSWFFAQAGHAGEVGGRLYTTSMATMILEVYYRHLPIYRQEAAEEDFPL
jgi:hypothetical protein